MQFLKNTCNFLHAKKHMQFFKIRVSEKKNRGWSAVVQTGYSQEPQ